MYEIMIYALYSWGRRPLRMGKPADPSRASPFPVSGMIVKCRRVECTSASGEAILALPLTYGRYAGKGVAIPPILMSYASLRRCSRGSCNFDASCGPLTSVSVPGTMLSSCGSARSRCMSNPIYLVCVCGHSECMQVAVWYLAAVGFVGESSHPKRCGRKR